MTARRRRLLDRDGVFRSSLRLAWVPLLAGCLGPVPQAADDGTGASSEGGGTTGTTTGSPTSTTSSGSTSSNGGGGSTGETGGGGSTPGDFTVGGDLHFLQGGSVTLANGSDTVVVDSNGGFTFPAMVATGAAYDVTVMSSPSGQTCWVQNGSGTAQANVTDVEVRCTTILQSRTPDPGSQVSTSSSSLVPIPNLDPITFTNDVDADIMATLLVPKLLVGAAIFRVALELDGTPIGEVNYQSAGAPLPGVTVSLRAVPAGNHTLSAVWSTSAGTLTQWSDVYRSEMNVVVLQSLPSFDRLYTSTLASNAGATSIANTQGSAVAMGFTPLAFDVAGGAQPALISLMANDLTGDRIIARLTVDGQGFAGSLFSYHPDQILVRSLAPMGLKTLAAGSHTIDADWFRVTPANVVTTRGAHGLSSALGAVLFESGTQSAVGVLEGPFVLAPLPASFTSVSPQLGVTLDLPKPSKVLLTFHASNLRPYPQWPASADVALFVDGVQGPTTHPFDNDSIDWNCQGGLIVGVVDAPAGKVTIDVRARQGSDSTGPNELQISNMALTDAARSIVSAVVLD
jgi:hypothetical protein